MRHRVHELRKGNLLKLNKQFWTGRMIINNSNSGSRYSVRPNVSDFLHKKR